MIEQTLKEVKSNQMTDRTQKNIANDKFTDILKGELSAIEAYQQAKDQFTETELKKIDQFRADHKNAFEYWKNVSNEANFSKRVGSGIWGKVVEGFVGTAKFLGDTTTIKALKKGEEHGLRQYQEMLQRDDIPHRYKDHIKNVFIPQTLNHINSLEAMNK